MDTIRARTLSLGLLLTACPGEKVETGESEGETETGDSNPGGDSAETGETGGGETGEGEHGDPRFTGYFLLGETLEDETCLNGFSAEVEYLQDDSLCPECDFGLDIVCEYIPWVEGAEFPPCDWDDLSSWSLGETFETTWAFAGDLQLAYYEYAGAWYPFADYDAYPSDDGDTLVWIFVEAKDDSGAHEIGFFVLYPD